MLRLPKLSSLLGTNMPRSQYRDNQQSALKNLGQYRRPTFQSLMNQGQAGVARVAPQREGAYNSYASMLGSSTGEDSRDALALGRMTTQNNRATQAARSNTLAGLRRAGISGGALAGALSNVEAGALQREGQTNTNLALDRIDRNERRAASLYGLTRAEQNDYQNQALQGSQGLDGINAAEFDAYGQMAREDEQRRAAEKQATMGALTGIAGIYGNLTGGRRTPQGSPPAPTTVNSLAGYQRIDAPYGSGGNFVVGSDGFIYDVRDLG